MRRVIRRKLYHELRGAAHCGQRGESVNATDRIEDVTCRRCVALVYNAAILAHYRAFPEFRGPRGKRVAKLVRRIGIEGDVGEAS